MRRPEFEPDPEGPARACGPARARRLRRLAVPRLSLRSSLAGCRWEGSNPASASAPHLRSSQDRSRVASLAGSAGSPGRGLAATRFSTVAGWPGRGSHSVRASRRSASRAPRSQKVETRPSLVGSADSPVRGLPSVGLATLESPMRRPGFEPEEDGCARLASLGCAHCDFQGSNPGERIRSSRSFVAGCAGRDLNPGHELGRLRSYH